MSNRYEKLQVVVNPYNRIMLSNKNEHITDMHNNWKNLSTRMGFKSSMLSNKRQTHSRYHMISLFEIPVKSNIIYRHRKQISNLTALLVGVQMSIRELFWVVEIFYLLMVMVIE